METISLKMDETLLHDIDSAIKNNRYSTRTEFIRDAIRTKLTQLEKEEAIRKLEKYRGFLKGKGKGFSDEQLRELASRQLAARYNINLD